MKNKVQRVASVFALLAESSIKKVAAVLMGMTVVELVLFYLAVSESYKKAEGLVSAPEVLIGDARISYIFLIALGALILILLWTQMRMSEKAGYTMMRLHLTRRQIFGIKTIYNVTCMVLLFVVQIWLAIGMICWYGEWVDLKYQAPQLIFLTFYRNRFLHCLMPMQEIGKWIRNILMIAALSMGVAGVIVFPGEKKQNRYPATINLAILMITWFISDVGKNLMDMACDIVFLGGIIWELLKVFGEFGRQEAMVLESDD